MQSALASMAGTARETATRMLSELEREKSIELNGKKKYSAKSNLSAQLTSSTDFLLFHVYLNYLFQTVTFITVQAIL